MRGGEAKNRARKITSTDKITKRNKTKQNETKRHEKKKRIQTGYDTVR